MTTTAPLAGARPAVRWAAWPWWLQVVAVASVARAVGAVIFVVVAATQAENPWTPASPSYPQYTGLMWDASWYRSIAEQGYPAELPVGADGQVQQNAWAFFPLFPSLAALVMRLTGLGWELVAPALSLVLGVLAMLVVHQVVRLAVGRSGLPEPLVGRLPLLTVVLLSAAPAAPVLQVAYTESLALLLVAGTLWCLLSRRYALAVPAVVALGLTRAVALPVAVAVVLHGAARWRAARAGEEAWSGGDRLQVAGLAVVAAASGLLWPALCGALTGMPDAYARTQAAWRARDQVVPVLPWLDVARWLLGGWGLPVLAVVVVGAVALVLSPAMRRLGPELQGWTGGYLAYLLAVIEPGTSLVRFLVLAFPVAGVVAQWVLGRRHRAVALSAVLVVAVLAQAAWVATVWRLVPPSGWPP